MEFSSSPPPSRREIEIIDDSDSDDELGSKKILCSPSPYFTQPTQPLPRGTTSLHQTQPTQPLPRGTTSLHQTQPTQVAPRTSLRPSVAPLSSSPGSVIEVPASSPFQPKPAAPTGRLGNAMAPPGTFFRPPPRGPTAGQKRTFVDLSDDDDARKPHFISDDSSDDDELPRRGDIQPSIFRRHEPTAPPKVESKPPKPAAPTSKLSESRVQQLAGKLYKQVHGRWSREQCRDALLKHDLDSKEAARYLEDLPSRPSSPEVQETRPQKDGSRSPKRSKSSQASVASNPSTPKLPRRGRLVQGRRNQGRVALDSSPSSVDPLSLTTAQIVDLVSDGDDDDDGLFDQGDSSPPPVEIQDPAQVAFEQRMLNYLNNCNAVQLMAIANIKADIAEAMLKHKPFETIDDARSVVVTKKAARKKGGAKVAVGDDVVDAIESFTRALDGIDHIVGVCEEQGEVVAAATSKWDVDLSGSDKRIKAPTVEADHRASTPASMDSPKQLKPLPISKEPQMMQGHCTMKPYQLYGLNWMYLLYEKSFGGILADDMGLGKTCQVISLMCAVVEQFESSGADEENRPWPNLVVVPPSTLSNWEAEFKKFAPGMNVISYSGRQEDRDAVAEEILENPADYHVILTTYTQLGRPQDIDNMRRVRPMIAVFDEGHKLKNPKTKLYKDLIRIPANWRLLLTGTPVQNNLMEMVALLQFVDPDLFRDHFDDLEALFNQKVSLQDVSKGALLQSERVTRARSILEPFILQRRKEQVLMSLPAKTSRVVSCELDGEQKKIYDEYERYFRRGKELRPALATGTDTDVNNVWMQLRKSAIHPQLFRRWFTDEKVTEMADILMRKIDQSVLQQDNLGHLISELKNCSDFELHLWCRDYKCIRKFDMPELSYMKCSKVQQLLKLIREYEKNGDKVLVFTRFAKVIEILRECLATEGVEYVALQGSTGVGDRQELIDQFQNDPSITAFLLTTGAGGTGINLTAANKVVVFDQSDNPQDDLQAENRAHRLGQTRDVEIIKLISKDTIEELVHAACEKKIELANRVTGWRGGNVEITAGEMEETIRKELMARGDITPPSSD